MEEITPKITREYCYDYFDCKEMDCLRRKKLERHCWEVEDVECKSHSPEFEKLKQNFGSKQEACKLCIYYQDQHSILNLI